MRRPPRLVAPVTEETLELSHLQGQSGWPEMTTPEGGHASSLCLHPESRLQRKDSPAEDQGAVLQGSPGSLAF